MLHEAIQKKFSRFCGPRCIFIMSYTKLCYTQSRSTRKKISHLSATPRTGS